MCMCEMSLGFNNNAWINGGKVVGSTENLHNSSIDFGRFESFV